MGGEHGLPRSQMRRTALLGALVVAGGLVAGCGAIGAITGRSPGVGSGYMARTSSYVEYLSLAPRPGAGWAGTLLTDSAESTGNSEPQPAYQVSTSTSPVTVTQSGSTVAVTLEGLLAQVTLRGTLSGDQMILTIPDADSGEIDTGTLTEASSAQFNSAVSALNKTIAADNTAAYRSYQAQQQAQADTAAEDQASSDMAALANADSFTDDLAALAKDVSQAQSDLGAVEQAVNDGQGSYCDGVYNANDAVYTVNDDSYSLSDDLDTLTDDIATARKDIQTLQGDLSSLQSSGLPAPQGANSTISAAQSAISSAVSRANSDIDAVNGYVASAYSAANGMATGSCSGNGPGSTPTPISHIS
jgi:hypothetical protein